MRTSDSERFPAAITGTLLIAVDRIGQWVGNREDSGPTLGTEIEWINENPVALCWLTG